MEPRTEGGVSVLTTPGPRGGLAVGPGALRLPEPAQPRGWPLPGDRLQRASPPSELARKSPWAQGAAKRSGATRHLSVFGNGISGVLRPQTVTSTTQHCWDPARLGHAQRTPVAAAGVDMLFFHVMSLKIGLCQIPVVPLSVRQPLVPRRGRALAEVRAYPNLRPGLHWARTFLL